MEPNYAEEPSRDILCIDVKSFYASVECVELGYHPLKKMLVVMSNAENAGGLVLAASPMAKKILGISNVSRKYEIPDHPDLKIVPPRMTRYIEKNSEINDIYRQYVANEDLHLYSIDESFLDVTASKSLFKNDAFGIAERIKKHVLDQTGLYFTICIGDNPLLAKLALANEAKNSWIAEWRYQSVPQTVWKISPMTNMWSIGSRTEKRLNRLGVRSIYDLAHTDFYYLREHLGLIGEQLYACAWGIDHSLLADKYQPADKSYGNSQVLTRDYRDPRELEIVIREMAEQVATRLRRHSCQTECVHLSVGYSDRETTAGFSQQMKIPATANSKLLTQYCLTIFKKNYRGQIARTLGITYSKLVYNQYLQLDLFTDPEIQISNERLDLLVDKVRDKFGFRSIVHASSLLEGATALSRSNLVGGHAGGMEGIR